MSQVKGVAAKRQDAVATVPVGDAVLALLDVAWRARRPLLLEGPTGVGKSQLVEQFCRSRGLQFRVLDLSLLEPPDLVGLPVIRDGRTHYAAPAELPDDGQGVLLLEELNRAELPVMQPALQLLSARRLHAWELPPGWSCVAAINPEGDDYDVRRLDAALRARFLQVHVRADRDAWLAWAERAEVFPALRAVVAAHPQVFQTSSPRSWAYLSDTWCALTPDELASPELRLALARGYLPVAWAKVASDAVAAEPARTELPLELLRGAGGPAAVAQVAEPLRQQGRTDALYLLGWRLRRLLREWPDVTRTQYAALVAPLPGDVRARCLDAFDRRGAA